MSEVPEEAGFLGEFGSRAGEGGALLWLGGAEDTELPDSDAETSKEGLPRWHGERHQGSGVPRS